LESLKFVLKQSNSKFSADSKYVISFAYFQMVAKIWPL
jgi:hypothetical protein